MQTLADYRAWLSPRKARFWVVILLVAYTLAGFLLVPWLLQRELPGFAQSQKLAGSNQSMSTVGASQNCHVAALDLSHIGHNLIAPVG